MNNVRSKNTKRSHLSKNKKKSWRKVDITHVEDFLEDERLQERTGGKVSEKKDEALFMLDSSKSLHRRQVQEKAVERKRKAQDRLTDVEISLKPPSPAKKDKRPKAMLERLAKQGLPKKFVIAEKQRQASRVRSIKKSRERPRTTAPDYDLWADDCKLEKETANDDDAHFLKVTKKRRVKVPKHHKIKPSLLPAVEVPHPGASYNPAYDEYQDLLYEANAKEEKKLRLEQNIQRALSTKLPTVQEAAALRMKEMSSGLFDDSKSEDEGISSDDEGDENLDKLSVNPPVSRENKKDEKKRKKQKIREDAEKKLKEEKLQRIRDNEIYRLKSIRKEIKEQEEKTNQRIKQREEEKNKEPFKTKRLGKRKYEEPDLEIKLTDELVGTLREVKPEGDLLEDRLKSLQKRNIVEPRARVKKQKKRNIKFVEKRQHKAITA